MKITPLNISRNYYPAFASNAKAVYNDGSIVHRNTTCFFREDLDWQKFLLLLHDKYKYADKVNIYCYACSDGSEPYSLAMLLLETLGEKKAAKFFPIIAVDYDPEILKQARSGIIEGTNNDIDRINSLTWNNFDKYLTREQIPGQKKSVFKIKENLKDKVKFCTGDIHKDVDNFEPNNSVLMLRNVWPYFPREKQAELVKKIHSRFKDNSLLVIGAYDRDSQVSSGCVRDMWLNGLDFTTVKYCYKINPDSNTSNPNYKLGYNYKLLPSKTQASWE